MITRYIVYYWFAGLLHAQTGIVQAQACIFRWCAIT